MTSGKINTASPYNNCIALNNCIACTSVLNTVYLLYLSISAFVCPVVLTRCLTLRRCAGRSECAAVQHHGQRVHGHPALLRVQGQPEQPLFRYLVRIASMTKTDRSLSSVRWCMFVLGQWVLDEVGNSTHYSGHRYLCPE